MILTRITVQKIKIDGDREKLLNERKIEWKDIVGYTGDIVLTLLKGAFQGNKVMHQSLSWEEPKSFSE